MAYKIESGTLNWANKRTAQLGMGIISTGAADEFLKQAIVKMMEAANEMPDQPESEMAKDYIMKLGEIESEISDRLREWKSDWKAISKGITAYYKAEKEKKNDC